MRRAELPDSVLQRRAVVYVRQSMWVPEPTNAIEQKFRQDAFFGTGTSAHTIAAAAQATHDVMNHIYPGSSGGE
jgi:hypothetical protein